MGWGSLCLTQGGGERGGEGGREFDDKNFVDTEREERRRGAVRRRFMILYKKLKIVTKFV